MKIKLLLLSILLINVFISCSNDSQDAVKNIRQKVGDAIAGEPTPTPELTVTTTIEPEPTPTPELTVTTTIEPEPTATPEPENCAPGKCSKNPVDEMLRVTFDEDGFYTKVIYGTSNFNLEINNISSVQLDIEITPTLQGVSNTIIILPNELKDIDLSKSMQSSDYNRNINVKGSWKISGSDTLSQSLKLKIVELY